MSEHETEEDWIEAIRRRAIEEAEFYRSREREIPPTLAETMLLIAEIDRLKRHQKDANS